MITCENLTIFNHTQSPIVCNVGFSIMPGGMFILRGANGSGKSRLLRSCAGIYTNYTGLALLDQKSSMPAMLIDQTIPAEMYETVEDFLLFYAKCYDSYNSLAATIHYFELNPLLEIKLSFLSAGQLQRVNLARLLLSSSRIWLLDEPEQHLDSYFTHKLVHLVKMRLAEGGAVLIATHSTCFDELGCQLFLADFKPI